jgi:hypothetical protein
MVSQLLHATVISAVVLVVALGSYAFGTTVRIVERLKSEHPLIWAEIGSPDAFSALMSSTMNLYAILERRMTLSRWLAFKGYLRIEDPAIALWAKRRRIALRLLIGIVLAVPVIFLVSLSAGGAT